MSTEQRSTRSHSTYVRKTGTPTAGIFGCYAMGLLVGLMTLRLWLGAAAFWKQPAAGGELAVLMGGLIVGTVIFSVTEFILRWNQLGVRQTSQG